ncbi:bile acid:sodium symporter family protein [Myxococcus xanthus]|uniref:Bile acid:sodium symporter family protein n=1 Tax=Myxococcus xanthus TaxID=34 RepID=A0A7Y4IDB6_MYXXA|nr:bile acid:sodium symporter family protein [Myxococcus xanthus]NOJ76974.1 bile acid:sodium symporter family protein [Myxococcus xanthus]NOJ84579.1 bile acid:sodium symporter family protein [Myxococcus xanthus]
MQSSVFTAVLMPLALAVIMLGLGLTLTLADFKRVIVYPRAILVGLGCQMLVLPVACLLIAHAFRLPPELAVGLMLLAASPGGATANLFSHLARGDVALNITLTAVNSALSLVTLPLIINLSLAHFMDEGRAVPMQFAKIVQVVLIVLGPVSLGMFIRSRSAAVAQRMDKPIRILSTLFLVAVIAASVYTERANALSFFRQVGPAALAFNLVSLAVGYFVPILLRLPQRQAVAIGMEIGIHNGMLAIAIALSPTLLANSTMAIPPAIYSLIMYFTAAAFGFYVSRRYADAQDPAVHRTPTSLPEKVSR